MKCPNCKKLYEFVESDDRTFPVLFQHNNPTCPFGIQIYHKTEEKAKEAAKKHILNKFPWMTEESVYLKD